MKNPKNAVFCQDTAINYRVGLRKLRCTHEQFSAGRDSTIRFPCQFRQNENELCQDENQDRVNEFHCRFREKMFRQYETEFCLKENDC